MQYSMPRTSFHLTVGQSFLPSHGVPPIVATGQSTLLHQMQPVGTSPYGQLSVVPSLPSTSATYATGQSSYLPPSQQTYRYTEPMTTPLDHKPFASHRRAINPNPTMDQKPFAAGRISGVFPVSPHVTMPTSHALVPPNLGYSLQASGVPYQRVAAPSLQGLEHSHCTPVESFSTGNTQSVQPSAIPVDSCSTLGNLSRSQLPTTPLDPFSTQDVSLSARPFTPPSIPFDQGTGDFLENTGTDARGDIKQCFSGLNEEEVQKVQQQQEDLMNLMAIKNAALVDTEGASQDNVSDNDVMLIELGEARQEVARFKEEKEEMKRELNRLREETRTMMERESAWLEHKKDMRAELHGARVELTTVLQEREENMIIVTQLTEALKEEQALRELAEQRIKDLRDDTKDKELFLMEKENMSAEIVNLKSCFGAIRKEVDVLRTLSRGKRQEQSWLESEVSHLRWECQRMTKERGDMKLENELNLQLVRKEIDSIHKELGGLRGQKSTLVELEVTNSKQECQSLRRENERSLEVVRNEMDAFCSEFDGMKGLSSKCQLQVAEREQEGNDIGSESQGVFRSELQ